MKGMFLLGHVYQASFPQVKFCSKCKQTVYTREQSTALLFRNAKRFWAYPAWLDKDPL